MTNANAAHEPVLELVSAEAYVDLLSKSRSLLCLYFSATWCAPSKLFEPKYKTLAELYPQVQFCKVDVDDVLELADSFSTSTIPTWVLIRNGSEVHRVEGLSHKRPARPISQAIGSTCCSNQLITRTQSYCQTADTAQLQSNRPGSVLAVVLAEQLCRP
eukprot:jgi/Chrzof1/252/Cz01g08250.t1